jgi:hypothetical protein
MQDAETVDKLVKMLRMRGKSVQPDLLAIVSDWLRCVIPFHPHAWSRSRVPNRARPRPPRVLALHEHGAVMNPCEAVGVC